MSYEKLPAAGAVPKTLAFFYPFESLFDVNSLWTMYKTIHKVNEAGESLVDTFAITEDERDVFTQLLSDAVYDVFSRFLKYTKGVTNAILFNAAYTPSNSQTVQAATVTITGDEGTLSIAYAGFNKAFSKALTDSYEDAIAAFITNATADYATVGVTLTAGANNSIIYTADAPGTDFDPITAGALSGDLAGAVTNGTAIYNAQNYVVLKIVDHEAYNANYLDPVNKILEQTIRFRVIREWFSMKDLDTDAQKADVSYKQNLNALLRHGMQLKKVSLGTL